MWLITSEDGGGTDFRFRVRFHFENEADARSAAAKLNNIGAAAYNLVNLPPNRKAATEIHNARLAAAMEVLQEMDPDATATTIYRVHEAAAFVQPSADPPVSVLQGLFRSVRDLND